MGSLECEDLILDLDAQELIIKEGVISLYLEPFNDGLVYENEDEGKIMEYLSKRDLPPHIKVILPQTLVEIQEHCFYGSYAINEVKIPLDSKLKYIRKETFAGSGLSKINLENSCLEIIGEGSFENSFLEKITFPMTMKTIDTFAFYGSESLVEVTFPRELETLGNQAFAGCIYLDSIDLSHTRVTRIPMSCFSESGIETIFLPPQLEEIGDEAFSECHSLAEIEIPHRVTQLLGSTLSNCSMLRRLRVYDTLEEVDEDVLNDDTEQNTDLVIDMGDLRDHRHEFPIEFEAFVHYTRIAQLEAPIGPIDDDMGTCRVRRVYDPESTIPRQVVLNCQNLKVPVLLANLKGDAFNVDISICRDMDDSLKEIAKIQYPIEIDFPDLWGILLDTEDNPRQDISIRELMELVLTNPELLTEPIFIVYREREPQLALEYRNNYDNINLPNNFEEPTFLEEQSYQYPGNNNNSPVPSLQAQWNNRNSPYANEKIYSMHPLPKALGYNKKKSKKKKKDKSKTRRGKSKTGLGNNKTGRGKSKTGQGKSKSKKDKNKSKKDKK